MFGYNLGKAVGSQTKPERNLAEAAEKAGLMIRGLQSRLMAKPAEKEGPSKQEAPEAEPGDDLDRQLQQYFAAATDQSPQSASLDDMRGRVLDAVVDKILREWEQSDPGALEHELADRLIQRLLDRFGANLRP